MKLREVESCTIVKKVQYLYNGGFRGENRVEGGNVSGIMGEKFQNLTRKQSSLQNKGICLNPFLTHCNENTVLLKNILKFTRE